MRLRIAKSPNETLALSNCVIGNPDDFGANVKYIRIDSLCVFTLKLDKSNPAGYLGTSSIHRNWAQLSINQEVEVQSYEPNEDSYAHSITFQAKNLITSNTFDTEQIAEVFKQSFMSQVFTKGQLVVIDFCGTNLLLTSLEIETIKINETEATESKVSSDIGIILPQSIISFVRAPESNIKLVGAARSNVNSNTILQPNFKFESMGIGGLDEEFSSIFRRAFASRIFPPALVEKLGIPHVKGILLYGPPGTGKTLMARQIGKMLNAKEPKIVNGPEILNKYVGQSEENVRNLFKEAEAEYKLQGENSQLHIIIFDELDAICKQRGSKNDGTGVGDSVVNQLLSKLDGVEQLNNILVIGMTNRKDMIDEALLRPGRLEIHVEIGLPDEKGRVQILKIHTSKMKENHLLHDDVDLEELASLTKNFTGAEIFALIKSASSFAFNRHVKVGTIAGVSEDVENMKITRQDFLESLHEVHAAFGVSDEEFESCGSKGIISYCPEIDNILQDGTLFVNQIRKSEKTSLLSVLLHGPPGSGKTSLAAKMAMSSDFPFIKLITPENMIGFNETAKVSAISRIFTDAYKSSFSVIVIDAIERLLDYVPIGPRFSNVVLQALLVLIKKTPPKGRKLLIFATTDHKDLMVDMGFEDVFNAELYIPPITEIVYLAKAIESSSVFSGAELQILLHSLERMLSGRKFSVSIKKLLLITEMASNDPSPVEKFLSVFQQDSKIMF